MRQQVVVADDAAQVAAWNRRQQAPAEQQPFGWLIEEPDGGGGYQRDFSKGPERPSFGTIPVYTAPVAQAAPGATVMDYDPNLTLCGRMAKQTVRLTFGMWEYRKTIEVEVGGNCTGLWVIDCAVSIAYDQLEQRPFYNHDRKRDDSYAVIHLPHPEKDDELETTDEDLRGEDWLKDMLVGAEIIAIRPDA